MTAIRNAAVAQGVLQTTGTNILYAVPPGNSLILKFVGLLNGQNAAGSLSVAILNPATNATIFLFFNQAIGINQTLTWSGWTVLNAGDEVYAQPTQTNLHYWLAGALLPHA